MTLKKILSLLVAVTMLFSCVGITAMAEEAAVTTIDTTDYDNFAAAMNAANNVSGAVEVEISGEVEFTDGMELKGNYTSIAFVGNGDDAKITINQSAGGDYLEAHGKTVAFTDLTLAKANPAWSGNSGHMGNYFSVQGGTVTYTDCIFPNGACTNTGTATYNNCTFKNTSEYGLWVYDDALVTVNGGTIDSTKGIKVYSEGETSVTSTLKVENATFTENVTAKPAVAIGYAESITLIGNTYNNTMGVLELDSGSDADCEGVSFVAQDANGNDIASALTAVDRSNGNAACGVLVDGKIYTTVAQAAEVATAGSKVTLLHDSKETVEFPEGVILEKNGHTADGVTVKTPANTIKTMAELVEAVQTANSTITVGAVLAVAAGGTYDLNLNGCTVKLGEYYIENNGKLTVTNGTIIADTYNSETNGAPLWNKGNLTVYENTVISGVCSAVRNDGGTCVIEAGTLNATCKLGYSASIIRMKSGSLTIKDGIFNGCDDVNLGEGCSILSADDGTTVIIGGTFNNFAGSPGAIFGKGIGVTVKGGTFNFENKQDGFTYQDCLANYLAPGYGVDENGVVSPYVASIGDDKYTSLADAVAVANDAHGTVEIKMIKNVEIAPTAIKGSIVLDLNGCTIYTTHNIAFQLEKNAALTIKDTSVEQDGLVKVEHTTGGRVIDLAAYDNTKFTLESGNLWSSEVGVYTASSTATVIVKGGSIICNTENDDADALQIQRGSAEVTGGTFSSDVTTYCADGYAGLPDLDGNYVVGETPTATVNNLGAMTIPANEYYIYDGSLTEGTVDMPLNFVMQFVADQDAEDMTSSPYADWYADFVITFDGIENDSFDPTGCYLAGYYGSTDSWDGMWVKIPVEGILTRIDEGTRYPVMMGVGMAQLYEYICSGVQAFSCAMFIPNEILEANPDLKVNLELNVVDSSDDEKALAALQSGKNIYKASETTYTAEEFIVKNVARIKDTEYLTLEAAIADAQEDDTIVLLENVTLGSMVTIPADKKITLDLNGKTVDTGFTSTGGNDFALCVAYGANLTIEDSSEAKTGTIDGSKVLGAVKMTNTGDDADNGKAILNVKGGKLIGNWYAISGNGSRSGTEITISGGVITAEQDIWGYGVFHPQNGEIKVTDGTIEAATGIEMRAGSLTVSGGTIKSTANEFKTTNSDSGTTVSGAAIALSQHTTNHPTSVTVSGGTLTGLKAFYQNRLIKEYTPSENVSATISGATLSGDVEAAEENYKMETNGDGSYTLTKLFGFYGSNVVLGNSLAMNFAVEAKYLDGEDYKAVIEHYTEAGVKTLIIPFNEWEKSGNSYYLIKYSNITAKQMSEQIDVTIYKGDDVQVSVKREDGLRAYALRMFANTEDDGLKTTLIDMLNYGAAAQLQFNYRTDELANAGLTDEQKAYASVMPEVTDVSVKDSTKCGGSSLVLKDNIRMDIAFKGIKDGMTATVSYEKYNSTPVNREFDYEDFEVVNNTYHKLTVDTLVIADANQLITVTVYNADKTVYTEYKDSMNSYLARQMPNGEDTSESGIYEATAKFTKSAYDTLN